MCELTVPTKSKQAQSFITVIEVSQFIHWRRLKIRMSVTFVGLGSGTEVSRCDFLCVCELWHITPTSVCALGHQCDRSSPHPVSGAADTCPGIIIIIIIPEAALCWLSVALRSQKP